MSTLSALISRRHSKTPERQRLTTDDVLAYILANGPTTHVDLMRHFGFATTAGGSTESVRRYTDRLVRSGLLVKQRPEQTGPVQFVPVVASGA